METNYSAVRFRNEKINGYTFLAAETQSLREGDVRREHLRLIGDGQPGVAGHPIVYSDFYTSTGRDESYVYARHRVDQESFFSELQGYLEGLRRELPEITKTVYGSFVQIEDRSQEIPIPVPMADALRSQLASVSFFRLNAPFGDMCVEFGHGKIHEDELRLIGQGLLPRKIETPLFGFDALTSELWVPFLAKIHWASDLIEPHVLRSLIRAAIRVTA